MPGCQTSVGSASSGRSSAHSAKTAADEASISAPPTTVPASAPTSMAPSWALVAAARRFSEKRSATSARWAVLAALSPT
jgi:hypothetical protein